MFQLNQMFLAEQQKLSGAPLLVGDKHASKSKIDAIHAADSIVERAGSTGIIDQALEIMTDGKESKSSRLQHIVETLSVTPESQSHEPDHENIRTLYAIVSSPDSESDSMQRLPVLLSDTESHDQS